MISTSSPLTTTSNVKHSKILNFPCAKFISGFHKYQCSRFENRNLLVSKVLIDCCTSLHQQRQHFKVKEKKRKPLTCLKIYLQQTTVFQKRKYLRFFIPYASYGMLSTTTIKILIFMCLKWLTVAAPLSTRTTNNISR